MIGLQENAYRVLDVPFDAERAQINLAMREVVRAAGKNVRGRGRQATMANIAQRRLSDAKQRAREDVLCCEVRLPNLDLSVLRERLGSVSEDLHLPILKDPALLSDLYFPENLGIDMGVEEDEVPYREAYFFEASQLANQIDKED